MPRGPRLARRAARAADRRPIRSCVSCRRRRAQDELVRVTFHDGMLDVDGSAGASRRSGRGAYLCGETVCVARALERDAALLRRALRTRAPAVVSDGLGRVGSPAS